ncbi:DEAD/DEAH box helicase [Serinicoccus kebangsaanensis]|uniref:DEAD/DEAH box helicase n=1 Tax=Serinicoccus kebangsaanensis TaxID=2602069 RepID=UPI00124E5E8C|nr:DEAD/DEAH box helicase [Serinicoccus kebangsaanensis]
MDRRERDRLRSVIEAGRRWSPVAGRVLTHRATTRRAAEQALDTLRGRLVTVRLPATGSWAVLPLGTGDDQLVGQLAAWSALHPVDPTGEGLLRTLAEDVPGQADAAAGLLGLRRFLTFGGRRQEAGRAAGRLLEGHARWGSAGSVSWLRRLDAQTREPGLPLPRTSALHEGVGLREALAPRSRQHAVLPLGAMRHLSDRVPPLASVITDAELAREAAFRAGEQVREAAVGRLLEQMPVDRLREATGERLRISALQEAGVRSVQQVLDRGGDLADVPGVGAVTAARMRGAAQTLRSLALEDTPLRLDPDDRSPEATDLLRRLHTWEVLRQAAKATDVVAQAQALSPLAASLTTGTTHLAVLGDTGTGELREVVDAVLEHATQLGDAVERAATADPWPDFAARPAHSFALLSELGLIEETGTYGDVPDDVVQAVREQHLDDTRLHVSLRGYQSFAARFALVQRKVVIGDEMGLGKTIEALAVLAHRASEGARWFLVVCPAAVLSNWVREIDGKTDLEPRRLHGERRDGELSRWRAHGGVAVTTYGTLGSVWDGLDGFEIDSLVVDEAHYVKNPAAQRSRRVEALVRRTQHVMLLTGTPLENTVGDFTTLIDYLQPELLQGMGDSPLEFRRRVAPVYLRRNTEDVLLELPELVEVEEWLELTAADQQAYRDAVASGNFMAMRRAAFEAGMASAKMAHLVEIVAEAEANGRRVLVFSYFRDVLDQVAASLPGRVFGPLTGSVPPVERQATVDDFSTAPGGAALVAQIQAVGVGLNIQAASVVVICEPQLKPTTEWQAIARARRMGQLHSVQVHRLLTEDSVDERLVELLSTKTSTFEDYARVSETAHSAPEAFDLSEGDLARQVIAAERSRLFPEDVSTQGRA